MGIQVEENTLNKYREIGKYHQGISIVTNQRGLKGAIDRNGNEVIACQYYQIGPFNKYGLAIAQLASPLGWGIIDREGNVVVPFKYRKMYFDNYDVCFYAQIIKDRYVVFDATGREIRGEVKKIDQDGNVYMLGNRFYDAKNGRYLDYTFLEIYHDQSIYYGLNVDKTTHKESLVLLDENLNEIDVIKDWDKNWDKLKVAGIISTKNNEYGYINFRTGLYVSPEGNKDLNFGVRNGGLAFYHVEEGEKYTLIVLQDKRKIKLPDMYIVNIESIKTEDNKTHLKVFNEDENGNISCGIFDENGTNIIPCKFLKIEVEDKYYIAIDQDFNRSIYTSDGQKVTESKYKEVSYLGEDRFCVKDKKGRECLIDQNGEILQEYTVFETKVYGKSIIGNTREESREKAKEFINEIKKRYDNQIKDLERERTEMAEFLSGTGYMP